MLARKLSKIAQDIATKVPVVTITGPRQAGKTTLVQETFPEYSYANLEDPKTRELAQEDYEGFFERYKEPLIIDEVQRVPELLSALQVKVDQNRSQNGRFILTGSHQPKLREGIAQSLAGRTSILTLLPLSLEELKENNVSPGDVNSTLLRGFMPELYRDSHVREPYTYYRDYVETYIERDVRNMKDIRDLTKFRRFLTLLAGRVGQVVNLSSLSGEVGVSSTTLNEWLSVLMASDVVFDLKPFFSNISKRHTKSSKIYFTEVGVAAYLLGLENEAQVDRDPLRGQLFENMVVAEALKARHNSNKEPNLFYTRTEKGVEVDMVLRANSTLKPFEIKSAMTPHISFAKNLKTFCEAETSADMPTVIYSGEPYPSYRGVRYVNYADCYKYFE